MTEDFITGAVLMMMLPILPMAYAEIHYRIPGLPSRLFRKEPELIFDLPHRATIGNAIPLFLFVKDAHRYPVELHTIEVRITHPESTFQSACRFEINDTATQRFYSRTVWLPENYFEPPGVYHIEAMLRYACRGKTRQLRQDNYVGLPKLPFELYLSCDPLPSLPGWRWGDLHVHSSFTDDAVEFGAPIAETACCAAALGLEFLAITDHSFDLDNHPDDYRKADPDGRKWRRFQETCTAVNQSQSAVTVIPGEEVSAGNAAGKNVHCLLLGNRHFYPGQGDSGDSLIHTTPTLPLFDLFKLAAEQDPSALVAAAHPFDIPPRSQQLLLNRGSWQAADLAHPGIDFWQILNGRDDDFFKSGYRAWRDALLRGEKPGILAGTDAHGNFNCFRQIRIPGWQLVYHRDQRLGQTRTGIFAPQGTDEYHLLGQLRRKHALISTGPVGMIEISDHAGTHIAGHELYIEGKQRIRIRVRSSEEFGFLQAVRLFTGDLQLQKETVTNIETSKQIYVYNGFMDVSLPAGGGYLRLEVIAEHSRGRSFCLTNPIWLSQLPSQLPKER